jgi:hypothetical protein
LNRLGSRRDLVNNARGFGPPLWERRSDVGKDFFGERPVKFRQPEERLKNVLRLTPLFFLLFAISLGGIMVYEYFTGVRDNELIPVMTAVFVIYFAFRSWHAVKLTFVFGDEEANGSGGAA